MVRWEIIHSNSDWHDDEEFDDGDIIYGEEYYLSASIQFFCEGESCGVGKTIHLDFDAGDEVDEDDLEQRINTEIQRLIIEGEYLCEVCKHSQATVDKHKTDLKYEYESNILHKSFCEKCGNEVQVRKAMGTHTQYQCQVCGNNSSLDSEGGWEVEESPESQSYGICDACNNQFISEQIRPSGMCWTCEEQDLEDWEDEMEDNGEHL